MVVLLPRLTKCCFCIPLRTGALMIGYFSLLLSLFLISIVSVSLHRVVGYVRDHQNHPIPGFTVEQMQSAALGLYFSHAYFILVFLICCIISLVLIIGVHKNSLRLVQYYVTISIVLLGLELALVVLTFVFSGLIAALPLLFWSLILYYFIIVGRSTYLEMEDRENDRKPPSLYNMSLAEAHEMSLQKAPTQRPLI